MNEKNIVLIGMRGTGKSKLGRMLAKEMHRKFVDIDEMVEIKAGKSISQIVEEEGWSKFRELEKAMTAKYAICKKLIIATGGGVILDKANTKILKQNGIVILLYAKIETLAKRVSQNKKRPAIKGEDHVKELKEIWEERKDLYIKAADISIDTSKNTENKNQDAKDKINIIKAALNDL